MKENEFLYTIETAYTSEIRHPFYCGQFNSEIEAYLEACELAIYECCETNEWEDDFICSVDFCPEENWVVVDYNPFGFCHTYRIVKV